MSETMTPIDAAAEAMEDAAFRLIGRDLGTIYRDRIATETVTAALDAVDLGEVTFVAVRRVKGGETEWADVPADTQDFWRDVARGIRAALLEGSDQ